MPATSSVSIRSCRHGGGGLCPQAQLTPAHVLTGLQDNFSVRLPIMQSISPPTRMHTLIFTHIPKCAGSSFRGKFLFEFVRSQRQRESFACVFYRDVHFRLVEHPWRNLSISRHGPDCLSGIDGLILPEIMLVTGHIAYHANLLSRLRAPAFSSVVLVREPVARLVSLIVEQSGWRSSRTPRS